jgi:hypothetical protein
MDTSCYGTRISLWHKKLSWWHLKFLCTLLLLVHETSEMREKIIYIFCFHYIFCFITSFWLFPLLLYCPIYLSILLSCLSLFLPHSPSHYNTFFTQFFHSSIQFIPLSPFLLPPISFICSSYHHPSLVP